MKQTISSLSKWDWIKEKREEHHLYKFFQIPEWDPFYIMFACCIHALTVYIIPFLMLREWLYFKQKPSGFASFLKYRKDAVIIKKFKINTIVFSFHKRNDWIN